MKKIIIILNTTRVHCRHGLDFWRIQNDLKGMPKIRHEKNTFDAKAFREKLEAKE